MSSLGRRLAPANAESKPQPSFTVTGIGITASTRPLDGERRFNPQPPPWGERWATSSDHADVDFVSLNKIEDSMQTMQRMVFDKIKPLEPAPGTHSRKTAPSPGLTNDMMELSFSNKHGQDEQSPDEAKPSMSFACLIAMAILDSDAKRLTVSEVYEWMKQAYPYFSSSAAGTGWKNSVRHNLSLNKHFVKQTRDDGEPGGKGSYWRIRPESMAAMESAIRKQGGGQLSRRLEGVLNSMGAASVSSHSSPKTFTPKMSLTRRGQLSRPKAQSSRRLQKVESTSTMDDHEAAAMLCSFASRDSTSAATWSPSSNEGTDVVTLDLGSKSRGGSSSGGPFPSLLGTRQRSRNNFFSTPTPPKQPKDRTQFKASYNPNPGHGDSKASNFTYVPSSDKQFPRRGLSASSRSKTPATSIQERLFTQVPPIASSGACDTGETGSNDVTIEDVGRTKSSEKAIPLFTFSSTPTSTSTGDSNSRFTPEGPAKTGSSRTRARADSTGSQSEGQLSGVSPRKTRRKLGLIDAEVSASMDTAAAALLEMSDNSAVVC